MREGENRRKNKKVEEGRKDYGKTEGRIGIKIYESEDFLVD